MKYTCPVCGYKVFDEPAGSFDICPICFWEDDIAQVKNPDMAGGANKISLRNAQKNFEQFGAKEERFKDKVRTPSESDEKDHNWKRFA